jgi:hypothetical protein
MNFFIEYSILSKKNGRQQINTIIGVFTPALNLIHRQLDFNSDKLNIP